MSNVNTTSKTDTKPGLVKNMILLCKACNTAHDVENVPASPGALVCFTVRTDLNGITLQHQCDVCHTVTNVAFREVNLLSNRASVVPVFTHAAKVEQMQFDLKVLLIHAEDEDITDYEPEEYECLPFHPTNLIPHIRGKTYSNALFTYKGHKAFRDQLFKSDVQFTSKSLLEAIECSLATNNGAIKFQPEK